MFRFPYQRGGSVRRAADLVVLDYVSVDEGRRVVLVVFSAVTKGRESSESVVLKGFAGEEVGDDDWVEAKGEARHNNNKEQGSMTFLI